MTGFMPESMVPPGVTPAEAYRLWEKIGEVVHELGYSAADFIAMKNNSAPCPRCDPALLHFLRFEVTMGGLTMEECSACGYHRTMDPRTCGPRIVADDPPEAA